MEIQRWENQFTMYVTGSLVNNQATDEAALELRKKIDGLAGARFKTTGARMCFGLDETGTGEVLGDAVLCCVGYPRDIAKEVEDTIGQTNPKQRKTFEHWDEMFAGIDALRGEGLEFQTRIIPPKYFDMYDRNKTMDLCYRTLLSVSMLGKNASECSIVLDDYCRGNGLSGYMNELSNQGAKIIVENQADDSYLEARLASILAKITRERIMKKIRENFVIGDLPTGSGNTSDYRTVAWLGAWKISGRPWPPFVRTSYPQVRRLDVRPKNVTRQDPPDGLEFPDGTNMTS